MHDVVHQLGCPRDSSAVVCVHCVEVHSVLVVPLQKDETVYVRSAVDADRDG